MFLCEDLEIWNLIHNQSVFFGAQEIFNVVGRVRRPDKTLNLCYSINGKSERPIFFSRSTGDCERLRSGGDFNIDTISSSDLNQENTIKLGIVDNSCRSKEYRIDFSIHRNKTVTPNFRLNLEGINYPQQVGQVVDGKWRVNKDEGGERCLEIKSQDAGYDRIILFGNHDWTTGYEVIARLCVKKWTGIREHGLGIGFKWNPHGQGNGTCLPMQWNTGLGLYYFPKTLSLKPGLRISIGVDVHFDSEGNYTGETVLGQGMFSFRRWVYGIIKGHIFRMQYPTAQIEPNKHLWLKMSVHPDRYEFTVWKSGEKEPFPQVIASDPDDQLKRGSVAIIAHHCALRVYELRINPIPQYFQ